MSYVQARCLASNEEGEPCGWVGEERHFAGIGWLPIQRAVRQASKDVAAHRELTKVRSLNSVSWHTTTIGIVRK
ncbi:hypothetical protein KKC08_04590 [Patescibacteria group bacterium]|nr:hypothetical protein [Patescibacteria group bacterium]MCG2702378.1 hypothetical protein [Candidatus Parcubacteria bacterium]MBU4264851.1 hypothetical protein [Patescibacteria group bacterium]MBU4389722.1 hypothetical protein [Patescibacteria group bacterium]MBU4397417.1 hypothetical protein [Patescibacteria group bacterium]